MGSAKEDIVKLIQERDRCVKEKSHLDTRINMCEDNVKAILYTLLPEVERAHSLILGHIECKESPTGQCVYDNSTDPRHEQCIFCGDPETNCEDT
jgi:hypothetical protein